MQKIQKPCSIDGCDNLLLVNADYKRSPICHSCRRKTKPEPQPRAANCRVCEVEVITPPSRGGIRQFCDEHRGFAQGFCKACLKSSWMTHKHNKRCVDCVREGRPMADQYKKRCQQAGCDAVHAAKGYCKNHYMKYCYCAPKQDYTKVVRSTRPVVCRGCKTVFQCSTKNANKYCTHACAMKYRVPWNLGSTTPRKNLPSFRSITCQWCKQDFASTSRSKKFCSKECMRENAIYAEANGMFKQGHGLNRAIEDHDYEGILNNVAQRVTHANGCWVWPSLDKDGYARHKSLAIYRIVLEAKHRAPLGSQAAHHMCANRACVNPDHLQPVTQAENTAEMLARNAFMSRIAELEQVVAAELSPNHPVLNRVPLGKAS